MHVSTIILWTLWPFIFGVFTKELWCGVLTPSRSPIEKLRDWHSNDVLFKLSLTTNTLSFFFVPTSYSENDLDFILYVFEFLFRVGGPSSFPSFDLRRFMTLERFLHWLVLWPISLWYLQYFLLSHNFCELEIIGLVGGSNPFFIKVRNTCVALGITLCGSRLRRGHKNTCATVSLDNHHPG